MKWYWLLLMVVAVQGLFLLAIWLLTRKKIAGEEKLDAERSKVKRLEEELQVEHDVRAQVMTELQRFADETKKVQEWYNAQKDRIAKEAQDAFQSLASDPSELDRRLDALLGTKARRDPTAPG
jgi:hypothetical protein